MIRQLKTKIKEQEISLSELSSTVERFLKIHPVVNNVKKLQGNISNISKHVVPQDKFKVTVPKIDDSEIVKPFTPTKKFVGMTVRQPAMKKSKTKPKKTCKPSKLFEDDEITECMTRWYLQAVTLDELRRLLYPREITMKELDPTKGCK